MEPLELWGGIECTVNRVGDTWFNQLDRNGHRSRVTDLDLIAGLGIRTLRYPVLWELTCPDSPQQFDWRWADSRLGRLRTLGIAPIVGLIHHGSGPAYTSLIDDGFTFSAINSISVTIIPNSLFVPPGVIKPAVTCLRSGFHRKCR